MKIKKVVIPTAGLATRMFPATKGVPKAMLPIFDKPTLQYVIEEVVEAGIDEVILIVNEDYFTIDKHFNSEIDPRVKNSNNVSKSDIDALENILKCKISFIIQKEQKGLGHAILCAKEAVDGEDFCVVLGDVIIDCKDSSCTKELVDIYNRYGKTVVGVETVPDEKRHNYGILEGKEIEKNAYVAVGKNNITSTGKIVTGNDSFGIYGIDNITNKNNITTGNNGVAIYGRNAITSIGNLTAGNDGIGIYGKDFSNGDSATHPNSIIETGENGIGVYTANGNDTLNLEV